MHSIYVITNTKTGKVYVGYTKHSADLRFAGHRRDLVSGVHKNHALQTDFNQDDKSWHVQVVESVDSLEEARQAESGWINAFPEVYNIQKRLNPTTKRKAPKSQPPRTAIHRAKISTGNSRACTLDGVHVFPSLTALIQAHGQGKMGAAHPAFRYIDA
jgi:predicted GIY-YIG superfamily endonuclease